MELGWCAVQRPEQQQDRCRPGFLVVELDVVPALTVPYGQPLFHRDVQKLLQVGLRAHASSLKPAARSSRYARVELYALWVRGIITKDAAA